VKETLAPEQVQQPLDIEDARRRCGLTMRNTNAGKWLAAALDELEQARAEAEEWKRRYAAACRRFAANLGSVEFLLWRADDDLRRRVADLKRDYERQYSLPMPPPCNPKQVRPPDQEGAPK